jgi:hypothetical protein
MAHAIQPFAAFARGGTLLAATADQAAEAAESDRP